MQGKQAPGRGAGPALVPTPREGLPPEEVPDDCRDQGQAPPTQGSLKEAERRIRGWFPSISCLSFSPGEWLGGGTLCWSLSAVPLVLWAAIKVLNPRLGSLTKFFLTCSLLKLRKQHRGFHLTGCSQFVPLWPLSQPQGTKLPPQHQKFPHSPYTKLVMITRLKKGEMEGAWSDSA